MEAAAHAPPQPVGTGNRSRNGAHGDAELQRLLAVWIALRGKGPTLIGTALNGAVRRVVVTPGSESFPATRFSLFK